ncbi:MAG: NAD(P)-binding protein, partial [Janthinobacterium lividum]
MIGAGIGGLAAAVRLAAAGYEVTVLEAQGAPGGKMREVRAGGGDR